MCNETVYNNNKMSLSSRIHVFNEGVNHIFFWQLSIICQYLFMLKYNIVVICYLWCYTFLGNASMINYRGNLDTSLAKMTTRRENQSLRLFINKHPDLIWLSLVRTPFYAQRNKYYLNSYQILKYNLHN